MQRFSNAVEIPPGTLATEPAGDHENESGRATDQIGNRLKQELAWATMGATLLAAAMTWSTVRHPIRTIPQDIYDPTLQAWQIAWDGHALTHQLLSLWNTNAIFPERLTLAFSDSLLGYAPFGLIGSGPAAAVLRYNVLFVLSFVLATLGCYVLMRQLGATPAAAVVAAVAFAYSPWRFVHAGHLNILSSGGIPLALAMLARGHGWSLRGGYSGRKVQPRWAFAGWLIAGWQISLGFGLGVPFAYVLAGAVLATVIGWLRAGRPALPARLLGTDLAGGGIFLGISAVMMYPYLRVLAAHPDARRSVADLDLFSPPLRGFFIAGEHSWLWGSVQQTSRASLAVSGEMAVLPGFAIMFLAGLGLIVSAWSRRTRAVLAAGVITTTWMAMGTAAPGHGRYGYLLLYRFLPGFDGSRTPGRLVLWAILLLCVLAAGTLTALAPHRARFPRLVALALTVSVLAVVAEGINRTPHPEVPTTPIALSSLEAPVLVLPTDELADQHVMLWSTDGFPTIVNGSSGYNPSSRDALRTAMQAFPDRHSVSMLRALGVKTVIVLPEAGGTPYESALGKTGARFGIQRSDVNGTAVFTVSPSR